MNTNFESFREWTLFRIQSDTKISTSNAFALWIHKPDAVFQRNISKSWEIRKLKASIFLTTSGVGFRRPYYTGKDKSLTLVCYYTSKLTRKWAYVDFLIISFINKIFWKNVGNRYLLIKWNLCNDIL